MSSLKGPLEALWRRKRISIRGQLEDPRFCWARLGREVLDALRNNIEVLPPEIPEVLMACRGAVECPSSPFDLLAHHVAEVLMGLVEGQLAEEHPHDLVGMCAPDDARLGEDHHVHLGFAVDAEGQEDLVPEVGGVGIGAPLDEVPLVGEAHLDELEVLPLEGLGLREVEVLDPAQGCEVLVEGPLIAKSWLLWKCRCQLPRRSRRCNCPLLRCLPPGLGSGDSRWRAWRRSWRRRSAMIEPSWRRGHSAAGWT